MMASSPPWIPAWTYPAQLIRRYILLLAIQSFCNGQSAMRWRTIPHTNRSLADRSQGFIGFYGFSNACASCGNGLSALAFVARSSFRFPFLKADDFALQVPSRLLQIGQSVAFLPRSGNILDRVTQMESEFPRLDHLDRFVRVVRSAIVLWVVYLFGGQDVYTFLCSVSHASFSVTV